MKPTGYDARHIIWHRRGDVDSETPSGSSDSAKGDHEVRLQKRLDERSIKRDEVSLRDSSESRSGNEGCDDMASARLLQQGIHQISLQGGSIAQLGDADFDEQPVPANDVPSSSSSFQPPVRKGNDLGLNATCPATDMVAMFSKIPLDSHGKPTSIGSVFHGTGHCTECEAFSRGACAHGIHCPECHMSHDRGAKRRHKIRPCKSKRERYRKIVTNLSKAVEEDPDGFDLGSLTLPPLISTNSRVREKLTARLKQQAERARADRARSSGYNEGEADGSE